MIDAKLRHLTSRSGERHASAETSFMNLAGLPAVGSSAGPGQPANSVR